MLEEAMGLHKEEERLCRELNYQDGLQVCLGSQALILSVWGRLEEAVELHEEEERICRDLNNPEGLSICLVNQGAIYGKKGEREKQIALLREALAIAREHGLISLSAEIEAFLKQIDPPTPPDKSYS